jgi:lauroyl/myristoyl acyltransferase
MSPTSPQSAVGRIRSSIPRWLLPLVVGVRFRLAWSRAAVREDARAQMRFLLEHTRQDADINAVARDYVRYQVRRGELRWHPEMITSLRVDGIEHLLAARDEGRGVLLNFVHHGYYDGAFPSIARYGVRCRMVVYPYMLEPDAPLWIKQHVALACTGGGTPVSAAVGNDGITDLLRQGEVVAIASDVPGRTPLSFVGRDVLGSFGAARLATDTNSPVIVMTSEEDTDGPFIRLHEPFEPKRYQAPKELLQALLVIHESRQVRWPEATDLPLSRWGTP